MDSHVGTERRKRINRILRKSFLWCLFTFLAVLIVFTIVCFIGFLFFDRDKIYKTTDINQYGDFGDYLAKDYDKPYVTVSEYVDGFLPPKIEEWFSNPQYSFQACSNHTMHEIYLEFVIEDEAQYDAYVQSVVGDGQATPFAYAEGFEEYVWKDKIGNVEASEEPDPYVSYVEIKKVLFSDESNTVIYVSLTIPWTQDIFPASIFAYFERFSIDVREY